MTETMTPAEQIPAGEEPVERLLAAADAMAAELAIGGLVAGPAGEQGGLADLMVDDAPVAAWAVGSDGTLFLVLLGPGGTARWPDPMQLAPVVQAAGAVLGAVVGDVEVADDVRQLPTGLDRGALAWAGAGVFDGDVPVASVGVVANWAPPVGAQGGFEPDVPAAAQADHEVQTSPEGAPAADGQDAGPAPSQQEAVPGAPRNLHLLADVSLAVTAELGRTTMTMGELLDLKPGGVIALEREAGAPIDIAVNHTLIARGEVVMVGGRYAVRITEVVSDGGVR